MYDRHTRALGRYEERAEIERLLDAATGGPAGLAVEGAPGIGKTTLWREALSGARGRGFNVIATAPAEPDASLAFSGLGDLFDGIDETALNALPGPQRRALNAALLLEDALPQADRQALLRAALHVLRALAAGAPLLVAIDDEQWLDRASARALAFALCRLRDERACVLLTRRPHSDGALWPELARGYGPAGLPMLRLGPLDMSAIHELLVAQLNWPVPRPVLRRIYAVSGGNPLYALAIARELRAGGPMRAGEPDLPIPETLVAAIGQRLDRLEPRAEAPLLVVSTLSNPTIAQIHAVLPLFALSDLDSARSAGIIDLAGERVRFTHPLLASTHYTRTPANRRRELHRMLAEAAGDEEERAHHLARGAEAPDRLIAMTLQHAADRASGRGAPEVAAELLEQACRLTPADAVEARHSRMVAAAEQHLASGDLAKVRAILEALLESLPGDPIRARALLLLARTRKDDFEAAAALAEQAMREAHAQPRVGAQAQSLLAELWVNRGDPSAAVEHARASATLAELSGDSGLLAETLALAGLMAFFNGDGVQIDAMTRAIDLEGHAGDTSSYYVPSTALGAQLLWSDDLDAARPLLERSLRRAAERGEEDDRGGLLFHLAHLEWEAGNIDSAQVYTHDAVELSRQLADEQVESYILWLQAFIAARHGNLDEARARAHDAIAVAGRIGDQFIVAFSTLILAAIELWTGEPIVAHKRLPALRDGLVGGGRGFVGSLTLGVWSYDVEALLAAGRLDEAEAVLGDLFERAHDAGNPNALAIAHRCRGLLLAVRGDAPAAIEALEQALAEHARRPLPLEVGRTWLERGTLERRAKRKSAAKRSLEEALRRLEPLSAAIWVARARDELSRVGLRPAAPAGDGLTPAQARVVELVIAGMSNREIADALHMSIRTVETHLTKVYRELGVKSRAQLAATVSAGNANRNGDPGDGSDRRPDAAGPSPK